MTDKQKEQRASVEQFFRLFSENALCLCNRQLSLTRASSQKARVSGL